MGASGDSVSGGGETMTGWAPPVLWALAAAGGLRVETSTPDALCPDLGQVRAAAQARLGDVEGEGDWRASYGLIHRPDGAEAGDVVRLELRDPGGRLRLRRELPRAGESCAALARAIVVVLDAYFRHPTEPPVPATAAREPPPLSAATASVEPARSPPRLSLDVAGGWSGAWVGGTRAGPVLALGLRLAIVPPAWSAGVEGAAVLTADTQSFGAARATLRSYGLRGFVTRDLLRRRHVALHAGPELLLALDQADAVMLPQGARRMRAAFGAGVRAQLQLQLSAHLLLSLLAVVDYAPAAWAGAFLVENSPAEIEIFPSSRVRLMVAGGVSWTVF